MIPIGIFTGYFPYTLDEVVRRIKDLGFSTVQLDLAFSDIDMSPGNITRDKCHRIRDAFRDANLPICVVSGYQSLVHPDLAERRRRIDRLKEVIRYARDLGCPYVATETGTFNPNSDWVHDPKNKTEDGYRECLAAVVDLAKTAYDHGATLLIENYVNNVIGSVEEVLRLFADVGHSSLGLLMDPTNYMDDSNIDRCDAELKRIFNAVENKVVVAHAKDCRRTANTAEKHVESGGPTEGHTFRGAGAVELPAPGLGSLNYDLYVRLLARNHPNTPLIIEHLEEHDIPRAKAFVDGVLKKAGV